MTATRYHRPLSSVLAVSAFSLLLTSRLVNAAGPDPATTCEADKLEAAGKKAACLATEETKAILGKPSNPAKCEKKFTQAFTQAEAAAAKAGGACPVTGDAAAIEQRIDATQAGVAQLIAGEGRFRDNGDGTVTDANTGLTWEKKGDNGGLHDKENVYGFPTETGTWISAVNAEGGTGFAGHSDWRMPTLQELQSIVDYGRSNFAIDPVFGLLSEASFYWSSTYRVGHFDVWVVDFSDGRLTAVTPGSGLRVRAVRGGL